MSDIIKTDKEGHWLTCEDMRDRAEKLQQICIAALSFPFWFPRYSGGVEVTGAGTEQVFVRGKGKFIASWCNQIAAKIASDHGYTRDELLPIFYARARDLENDYYKKTNRVQPIYVITRADTIYYQSIECAREGIITEITEEEAQYLSWIGVYCYAVAGIDPDYKSPYTGRSLDDGHIAAYYPTGQGQPARVANGGGINVIDIKDSPLTFGVPGLLPIRNFHLPYDL